MKAKTILLFTFLITTFTFAQSIDEVYFNLNLKDEEKQQLLHVDMNSVFPYMIHVKLKGSNFLGLGRYTIREMDFRVDEVPKNNLEKPIQIPQNLYIKDIKFKCFTKDGGKCSNDSIPLKNLSINQSNKNDRVKRVAHFKVDLTTTPPENEFDIASNMRFSVYDNAIFDFHIKINGKEPEDFFNEIGIYNFGGHICKVRINY